ncbi:MAG: hypothetical protein GAK32_00915 [Pseudomonas fluorescens]|nr:MAG: hypothetical protein GAK32_00915 [Pseudomonas fluorescens]
MTGLLGLLLAGCSPSSNERILEFDVPYGFYGTYLQQPVGSQGQLTCKVKTHEEHRGEKWTPSVVLAAAEDEAEDDTLFLSTGSASSEGQRSFEVRTFNKAKPVISNWFVSVPDDKGAYTLRLSWHADGSIDYQIASDGQWSEALSVQNPGFSVRHVSVHATSMRGTAACELTGGQ